MEDFDYKEEDDEGLLLYLQLMIEDNQENRYSYEFNSIFTEFYSRNAEYVYNICRRYKIPTEKIKDAMQTIFLKIVQSVEKFNPDKLKRSKKNPVKGWIGVIAKNQLNNIVKSNAKNHEILFEDWLFTHSTNEKENLNLPKQYTSNYRIALEKAFSNLSERDKSLILVYYNHISFEKNSRLPKGKLGELAKMFDVEEENFTKIRQRILKRLKKAAQTELAKLSP